MITLLLKKLTQKSRLNYYKEILELAIDNGYYLTSLVDWYQNQCYPDKKVLVLRHDVDHDTQGAFRMFRIEKELGAKSTFYFRWNTISKETMYPMHHSGFEVSLHYETLANYCKKNKILSKNLVTDDVVKICNEELKKEVKTFTETFWNINSICSHGDKRNRILGIANTEIAKEREGFGIDFEAYDPVIKDNIDVYISDSSIKNDHKWKGKMDPEEALKKGYKNICILTHPSHWNYNLLKTIRVSFRQIKEDFFSAGSR